MATFRSDMFIAIMCPSLPIASRQNVDVPCCMSGGKVFKGT